MNDSDSSEITMFNVYIRPLRVKDAYTSWKWRNDEDVWRFTGRTSLKKIELQDELNWINKVLNNSDERRFAICLAQNDRYIGNIQLTDIVENSAQYHIFIGEKEYWGQGIALKASRLLLEYAKINLNLRTIYLFVKKDHTAAIKLYSGLGFLNSPGESGQRKEFVKMEKAL